MASAALEALGWEDVLCLKGGSFAGWAEAGYEVSEGLPSDPVVLDGGPELVCGRTVEYRVLAVSAAFTLDSPPSARV